MHACLFNLILEDHVSFPEQTKLGLGHQDKLKLL